MSKGLFKSHSQTALSVFNVMRAYYLILLALINIYGVPKIRFGETTRDLITVWPMKWLHLIGAEWGAVIIVGGAVAVLLLTIINPLRQSLRVLSFVFLFLFNGYFSSFGGVTHLWQFWLWSSFVLALMPTMNGLDRRVDRQMLINTWFTAQGIFLLFYSLSGFWKGMGAVMQFANGEPTVFSVGGLSYHVASEVIRANMQPVLAGFVLDNPQLSPFLTLPVVFIQLFSIFALFKFSWHRAWGLALILFHLGTFLVLQINYPTNFALVGVMLLASPFTHGGVNPIKRLNSLQFRLK